MKRIILMVPALAVFLVGCGTTDLVTVMPLDDSPTPQCVAIESLKVEEWDHDLIKKNYTARYCLGDE